MTEDREAIIKTIEEKLDADAGLEDLPIPDDKLPEICGLIKKRDEAIEFRDSATTAQERDGRDIDFIKVHKQLITAYGLKPCESRDCTRYLTGGQRKYCSKNCKTKEKSRRQRERNPEIGLKSQKKYIDKYYPEID